jgi:hypothetical protein
MSANESEQTAKPSSTPEAGEAPSGGVIRPADRQGHTAINAAEKAIERGLDRGWARFSHRPYVGAAIAGGVGLAVATVFGAAEVAFGAAIGYAAYQVLKKRIPPSQAIKEAFHLEKQLTG